MSTTYAITEALAETKTIAKRLASKRQFIAQHLARHGSMVDPLASQGGSAEAVRRERQAMRDLEARLIGIRRAISKANDVVEIELHGERRTIAEWLTWRREVAPGLQTFLREMQSGITRLRQEARNKGWSVNETGSTEQNVYVNLDEIALAQEIEQVDHVLGDLDGALSLKNATTNVEVAD